MKDRVQRTRPTGRAAEQLLDMVISEGLRPGERHPPERELCGRLGVSRTVVREASNLVEARGLISIEHGRGAGGDAGPGGEDAPFHRRTRGVRGRRVPRAAGARGIEYDKPVDETSVEELTELAVVEYRKARAGNAGEGRA